MTNREKLRENYEDSVLALLMDELAESEGRRYIEENERLRQDPAAAVPAEAERRALQFIDRVFAKKGRAHTGGRALRFLGRLAIAAVIAALLFGAAFALSETVRAGTLNFLMRMDERIATWQFTEDDAENNEIGRSLDIVVGWLPDGFIPEDPEKTSPTDVVMDCTNDAGGVIRISAHESEDFIYTLDLEDADYYNTVIIQECEGMLRIKDGYIRIAWPYHNTELVVSVTSSGVDSDSLIRVAESISIVG